jgi:hypothetical protein
MMTTPDILLKHFGIGSRRTGPAMTAVMLVTRHKGGTIHTPKTWEGPEPLNNLRTEADHTPNTRAFA